MADDLNTILTNSAQQADDRDRLANNVQDASIVNPAGRSENPGGRTVFGDGTDNTITERAPEGKPLQSPLPRIFPAPEATKVALAVVHCF